jgi:hypothetical protein
MILHDSLLLIVLIATGVAIGWVLSRYFDWNAVRANLTKEPSKRETLHARIWLWVFAGLGLYQLLEPILRGRWNDAAKPLLTLIVATVVLEIVACCARWRHRVNSYKAHHSQEKKENS